MEKEMKHRDVYLQIKDMIQYGWFAPNGKINQLQLAKQLKVSRTPIAMALYMLKAEGYLDQKHNSGFYVHRVTLKEVQELLLARASLESAAVYDIAENADAETLEQISNVFYHLEAQEQADNQDSRMNFLKADQQFHKTLLQSCKNSWVMRINENIKILEHPNALGTLRRPEEVLAEHRQVLQAILKKDAPAAQMAMFKHILHTRTIVMEAAKNMEDLGMDASKLFQVQP